MKLEELVELNGRDLVKRLNQSLKEGKITMKEYKSVVDTWTKAKKLDSIPSRKKLV